MFIVQQNKLTIKFDNKLTINFPIAIVKMHNRIIFTLKFKIGSLDLLQTRQIQTIL